MKAVLTFLDQLVVVLVRVEEFQEFFERAIRLEDQVVERPHAVLKS